MQTKFDESEYSALLERIFAITPSVQSAGFTAGAYKPGLAGMEAFDARLGQPWKQYRCVHVAGTNGKGSVASMIASALASGGGGAAGGSPARGGGARVGLYTSPHLIDFRERMKVVTSDGWAMPSKEEVWEFFRTFLCDGSGGLDTHGLSFFEMTTGLAFWWFARQKVDWAVIEAGLGGRLDSTNIIIPELSVITSIGLDHCALLGSTRAAIASEKAGIFKPGAPAVVASEDAETAPVFRETAARVGCPLFFADSAESKVLTAMCLDGQAPDEATNLSRMDLQGPCQKQNLHTVLVSLSILGQKFQKEKTWYENGQKRYRSKVFKGDREQKRLKTLQVPGFQGGPGTNRAKNVTGPWPLLDMAAAIERTAEITGLRGRWERLQDAPEVICDIGHNPPALEINFRRLREIQSGGAHGGNAEGDGGLKEPGRPLIIVYGIMADKDLSAIAPLMPSKARYILAAPAIPRALKAEELQRRLSESRPELQTETAPSVASAVEKALAAASPETLIYIGGSTFVVTEAIQFFNSRQK